MRIFACTNFNFILRTSSKFGERCSRCFIDRFISSHSAYTHRTVMIINKFYVQFETELIVIINPFRLCFECSSRPLLCKIKSMALTQPLIVILILKLACLLTFGNCYLFLVYLDRLVSDRWSMVNDRMIVLCIYSI